LLEQGLHITKHYYTIGEVAKLVKVSTSLLRYWEREFQHLKPQKNKQGIRKYSQADIQKIKLIYQLVKEQGYTIRGAKEVLQRNHYQPKTKHALILALKELKAFLNNLEEPMTK
jgi:DNA-binding transcriptional MerR regulator